MKATDVSGPLLHEEGDNAAQSRSLEDDSFDFIDSSDYSEHNDFHEFPWLDPNHPLYFPSTQPNNTNPSTRWEAMDKFSVENWYPHLNAHTFKSHFVTLDHDDIQFLMGNGSPEYNSAQLENRFDHILSQCSNQEAFMRLSTRSPKDSKHLFDEAATIMSNDFSYWNETDNKHQQLVSFVVSMTKAMKVTNAKKIIETITGSPKVYNDLLALINLPDPLNCATKVVLREWYSIRPDHEFRVFVSRRCRKESIVTAISQYFHFLYFDKIPADCFNFLDEESKKNLILKFQNYILKLIDPAVAHFLNFSSEQDDDDSISCIREYIVDLALIPINQYHGDVTDENKINIGGSSYIIMVIELNPFAPSATGSFLFNWKTDLNRLWGKDSCEYPTLRYRTTPREDLHSISLLPLNYEQVIQNALTRRLANTPPQADTTERLPTSQSDRFFSPAPSQSTTTATLSIEELQREKESSHIHPGKKNY